MKDTIAIDELSNIHQFLNNAKPHEQVLIEDTNTADSVKLQIKDSLVYSRQENIANSDGKDTFEGNNLVVIDGSSKDSEHDSKKPDIPDGGWGWVVVASCFLVAACSNGIPLSYGLLQEEFSQQFEGNQSKISLIGSIFLAAPLFVGPIMSALVDRFGCRRMTIVAGVLSTVSFLLASISNSVEMLCLTFGLMGGLAMGILYVTAVVPIAFWFEKKRNLAFSLALSGSGFGMLVYSPLTHYFLQIYDWRNTIVLLAGTLLNMCVCGALMRTPEWLRIKQNRKRRHLRSQGSHDFASTKYTEEELGLMSKNNFKMLVNSSLSPEDIFKKLEVSAVSAKDLEPKKNAALENRLGNSNLHLPTYIQQKERVPQEVIEKHSMVSKESNKPVIYLSRLHEFMEDHDVYKDTELSYSRSASSVSLIHPTYLRRLPRANQKFLSLPYIYNTPKTLGAKSDKTWYQHVWEIVKSTFNFKMYTEFHFFMFNLSMLILSMYFIPPYFFLKSFMTARNIEGGEIMLSIIGISNGIGIVVLGWTADQRWVDVTKAYAICLSISGLSVAAYPFVITSFWGLSINSAFFGFSFASCYSYSPAVLLKLVPMDYFTTAYGLILLVQGFGHLAGPPFGGMLYDLTGTWDLTFYVAGVGMLIAAICLVVMAYSTNVRMCGDSPLLNDVTETSV